MFWECIKRSCRTLFTGQSSSVKTWKFGCDTEIIGHTKKRDKIIKIKDRLKKLGLTSLLERRMRNDLIEAFERIEFLIMIDICSIFFFEFEIHSQDRFQKICLLTEWDFLQKDQ